MKSRTIILLWVIALILGATIFLVKRSQGTGQEKATARSPGQTLLENFPADQVATIEISGADGSAELVEKEGAWTVSQRENYPANTRNINDLLRILADLKVTQGIEAGTSMAPRFGMDENSTEAADHGITALFKDTSGKEIATLTFGKNLDSAASQSPFGGGSTGRYVRNHSDDSGFYAVSELFGTLTTDPKSWLNDEFLKIEKIKTISLSKPGSDENEWTLTRETEDGEFAFTDAFPGVKTDPAVTGQLKTLFSYARFDDVVPASEAGKKTNPEKLQKAVITTFEGLVYTVAIQPTKPVEGAAESAPQTYLMTFSVSGDLPKERKKPEGEKEEDAKIADKAFTERLATLKENMEKTKALESRTFEVSNTTVGALLKSRTDLMLKTPAPEAAAPSPSPVPPGTSAFTPPIEIPAQPAPETEATEKEEPLPDMPEPELPTGE